MVNYYEIVGVPRTATGAEIEDKIKQEYRANQRRVNNSDQSKRQAAERRAEQLMEARRILLDETARRAYDQQLLAAPPSSGPSVPPDAPDWLAQARRLLEAGDFHGARYCAREARGELGEGVAEVWGVLAEASSGLGNLQDSLFEAQRAVSLEPANADYRFELGVAYEKLGRWDAAIAEYQAVQRIDPDAEYAALCIANALQCSGRTPAALHLLEHTYANSSDREFVGNTLGFSLLAAAEAVPAYRKPNAYIVTSPAEIGQMRQLLARAAQVASDPELRRELAQTEDYLRSCEVTQVPKGSLVRSGGMIGFSAGALGFVVLCLSGASAIRSTAAVGVALAILGLYCVILALVYLASREPQWRTNLANFQREQAMTRQYTGIR